MVEGAVRSDARLLVSVGDVEIRLEVGVDIDYVAALVARLRGA